VQDSIGPDPLEFPQNKGFLLASKLEILNHQRWAGIARSQKIPRQPLNIRLF